MTGRIGLLARRAPDRALLPLSEWWWDRSNWCRDAGSLGIRSCLVLAPHPDDETLGCGGTISSLVRSGVEVRLVIATDGNLGGTGAPRAIVAENRSNELISAASELRLTADRLVRWGLPDGDLRGQIDRLSSLVAATLDEWSPDCLMVTCRLDPHPDHRALARAVAAEAARRGIRLMEYPIWLRRWPARALSSVMTSSADRRYARNLSRRVKVGLDPLDLAAKQAALACYRSQIDSGILDERFLRMFRQPFELFVVSEPPY